MRDSPSTPGARKKCYLSTVLRTDNLEQMTLELISENEKEDARGREFLVEGTEGAKEWAGRSVSHRPCGGGWGFILSSVGGTG